MIPTSDQWKLNGNCNLCRRKNYCHSKCKKKSEFESNLVRSLTDKVVTKSIIGDKRYG